VQFARAMVQLNYLVLNARFVMVQENLAKQQKVIWIHIFANVYFWTEKSVRYVVRIAIMTPQTNLKL